MNSENGKYLTGLDAQRVIVEGMRKKVESMKTLMTPSYSTATGSVFNFPTRSSGLRASASAHSINSNSDEVFRGECDVITILQCNTVNAHLKCVLSHGHLQIRHASNV